MESDQRYHVHRNKKPVDERIEAFGQAEEVMRNLKPENGAPHFYGPSERKIFIDVIGWNRIPNFFNVRVLQWRSISNMLFNGVRGPVLRALMELDRSGYRRVGREICNGMWNNATPSISGSVSHNLNYKITKLDYRDRRLYARYRINREGGIIPNFVKSRTNENVRQPIIASLKNLLEY